MSGTISPNGQRALFANAPVMPAAPTIPTVPPGSNLAAAMMSQGHGMAAPPPNFGGQIPLASIMQMVKAQQQNPTPGNNQSALTQQPDGTWAGTPGQAPAPQTLSYATPTQGPGPGMPTGGPGVPTQGAFAPGAAAGMAPGMPSQGVPGAPTGPQPGPFGQALSWLQNVYGGGGG